MSDSLIKRIRPAGWFALGALALLPWPAAAASAIQPIVPLCASTSGTYGNAPPVPQLSCAMEMVGNIALLILGVTGSFALLMFVYGGFTMVIAGGDSGRYEKGKTVLRNAVIGILIIMTSGILLRYGVQQLTRSNNIKMIGQPCNCVNNICGTYVQSPSGAITCEKKAANKQ